MTLRLITEDQDHIIATLFELYLRQPEKITNIGFEMPEVIQEANDSEFPYDWTSIFIEILRRART